jgi:hypothetical protein
MSIATAPLAAASSYQDIARAVTAYLAAAREAAADGLTWQEFGELLVGLLRLAISTAEILQAPGAVKKALVMESVEALFDSLADRCVPAYAYPLWLVARPAVRQLVLALASGAIEQLLPR